MNSKELETRIEASLQGEACTLIRVGEHNELILGFGSKTTKTFKRSRDGKTIAVERTPWEFRIPGGCWAIKDCNKKNPVKPNEINTPDYLKEKLSSEFKSIAYVKKSELQIILKNKNAVCIHTKRKDELMVDLFRPIGLSVVSYISERGWQEEGVLQNLPG